MHRKKLLILCQDQWGYHIDTYKYATYLKDDYDITYFCWDYDNKTIENEGVIVKYISRRSSLLLRNFKYIYSTINEINKSSPDICFIKYFRGCSILKLIFWNKLFIFDIRTGSVGKNRIKRLIYDYGMLLESKIFTKITVISKSLANNLKLEKKAYILPLGSNVISKTKKEFGELKLIYVGTLNGRDVTKTIEGFAIYLNKYSSEVNAIYTIVGDGRDMEKIKKSVKENDLDRNVNITGHIPLNELEPIMDAHNIGISFVPCTNYYDCQPVTKTFDYLLSGMPVIATNTSENKAVINSFNGICIADNPESFAEGIYKIYNNISIYNSEKIRSDAKQYDWKYIIHDFKIYLNDCLQK